MIKLLTCLVFSFVVAVLLLQLRHERTEINYQINQAHRELQDLQIELWNQQLQVAIDTAPNAIEKTVGAHKLDLVPAQSTQLSSVNTQD